MVELGFSRHAIQSVYAYAIRRAGLEPIPYFSAREIVWELLELKGLGQLESDISIAARIDLKKLMEYLESGMKEVIRIREKENRDSLLRFTEKFTSSS